MSIITYSGGINRDTNVGGANVYAGNGQGCGTVWYRTVEEARRVIERLGKVPSGRDSGLCEECKCHFSYGTKAWKNARDYACNEWKAEVAGYSQD